MFGRIENFWIVLAVIIGSAVWEWIKKRSASRQAGPEAGESRSPDSASAPGPTTATAPAAPPRPSMAANWEEELRRLLSGETATPKPPPAAAPPIRPVVIQQEHPASRPVSVPPPVRPLAPSPPAQPRMVAAHTAPDLPVLTESRTAYQRASHLPDEVAQHLKRVDQMVERHLIKPPAAHRQAVSVEAARTISMIRNPATARQAIIASIVFGPPKALERE